MARRKVLWKRGRHFILLVPMGTLVGLVAGIIFHDVIFAVIVGAAFGVTLATLFTIQTH